MKRTSSIEVVSNCFLCKFLRFSASAVGQLAQHGFLLGCKMNDHNVQSRELNRAIATYRAFAAIAARKLDFAR